MTLLYNRIFFRLVIFNLLLYEQFNLSELQTNVKKFRQVTLPVETDSAGITNMGWGTIMALRMWRSFVYSAYSTKVRKQCFLPCHAQITQHCTKGCLNKMINFCLSGNMWKQCTQICSHGFCSHPATVVCGSRREKYCTCLWTFQIQLQDFSSRSGEDTPESKMAKTDAVLPVDLELEHVLGSMPRKASTSGPSDKLTRPVDQVLGTSWHTQ